MPDREFNMFFFSNIKNLKCICALRKRQFFLKHEHHMTKSFGGNIIKCLDLNGKFGRKKSKNDKAGNSKELDMREKW